MPNIPKSKHPEDPTYNLVMRMAKISAKIGYIESTRRSFQVNALFLMTVASGVLILSLPLHIFFRVILLIILGIGGSKLTTVFLGRGLKDLDKFFDDRK